MFGPVLHGEKVTLRPPGESDVPRYLEWFSDMEVTRFLGRVMALSREQELDWLKRTGESRTDVVWVIEVDGEAIGATGIHRIDWTNGHGITGITIGAKDLWGKGYASETMALRTEYAFRQLNLNKLTSMAFMENEASKRALTKAGYREVGVHRQHYWRAGAWKDVWVCEVLREDWERAHSR